VTPTATATPAATPAARATAAAVPVAAGAKAGNDAAGSKLSHTQQAQRLLEKGRSFAAIEAAKKATAADPTDAEAWLTLGAAYELSGNKGYARAAYKSCVTQGKGPRVSECQALLGQ
jgi:Flp pilus assembly protein TadD